MSGHTINHIPRGVSYAASMSALALQAWISLYLAVAICAAICAALAVIATTHEVWTGSWRPALTTRSDWALALPRLWVHWQLRYLSGAPVVFSIGLLYAHHLGFKLLASV